LGLNLELEFRIIVLFQMIGFLFSQSLMPFGCAKLQMANIL